MLNRLRIEFVFTSVFTLVLALTLVMGPVYLLVSETFFAQNELLVDHLIDNGGTMPHWGTISREDDTGGFNVKLTPELQYETRYFTVYIDENDTPTEVDVEHINGVDEEEAMIIAEVVLQRRGDSGRYLLDDSIFFYKIGEKDGVRMVVCVDCTSRMWIIRQVMYYMLTVSAIITLVFAMAITFLSKRIMEPFIRNTEKQKMFITNASHELKTPLAVISANTEMTEMTSGKTKWTESTLRQIQRMNTLISELVTLSRVYEKDELVLQDVAISDVVREQADSFEQVILQQGKDFQSQIAEDLHIRSEMRIVQELTTILLDNAAKYCDEKGTVYLELRGRGKGALLLVTNTYAAGAEIDYKRFFERFYREDQSHNSKKKGFGIGLSIAKELCGQLGAKISVAYKNGVIGFTILFPG